MAKTLIRRGRIDPATSNTCSTSSRGTGPERATGVACGASVPVLFPPVSPEILAPLKLTRPGIGTDITFLKEQDVLDTATPGIAEERSVISEKFARLLIYRVKRQKRADGG